MKIIVATLLLTGCTAETEASGNHEEQAVFSSLRALVQKQGEEEDKSVNVVTAFLNLDSEPGSEVVAFVSGRSVCGSGGCRLYILKKSGGEYKQVTKLTVVQLPIQVFNDRSHDWLDLGVGVQGGGINPGYDVRLRFNGQTYPSNPSVQAAADHKGRIIISNSSTTAKPLFK